MRISFFSFVTTTLIVLATGSVAAHPGHGHDEGWSLTHFISQPEHFIPIIIAALLIAGIVALHRRRAESASLVSHAERAESGARREDSFLP